MTTRVAINGLGRIGGRTLRALFETGRNDMEIVAINDLTPIDALAHLFEYDSVHGQFNFSVSHTDSALIINSREIPVFSERDASNLNWGANIVLDCTGRYLDPKNAEKHLKSADQVLLSAPAKGEIDNTIVYGVNDHKLTANDRIVSNASCTTNCLAPVAKVLNDTIGIERGSMITIHAYTSDQSLTDGPHADLYRARAASLSMIPTSTGAAKTVGLIIPELQGKLDGSSVRVPTPNVSLVEFTFVASRDTSIEEVNNAITEASNGPLKGVLGICSKPLVSIDFNGNPLSSIFALDQTKVNGNLVTVKTWYDNETGFSHRMLDTAAKMASLRNGPS